MKYTLKLPAGSGRTAVEAVAFKDQKKKKGAPVYDIVFRKVYRYQREYNWGIKIWTGAEFAKLEIPIKAAKRATDTPVVCQFKVTNDKDKTHGHFSGFEEFMTAFKIMDASKTGDCPKGRKEGARVEYASSVRCVLVRSRRVAACQETDLCQFGRWIRQCRR